MRERSESSDATPPVADGNAGWKVIGQLAAGIAHEIKTPTQYVGDNVRFLQESFGDLVKLLDEYKRALATADAKSMQSVRAAEEALDVAYILAEIPRALEQSVDGLARISSIVMAIKELSHPGGEVSRDVDINHLVRSSVTVCAGEWKSAANLQLDLAGQMPVVQCCAGPISQVLINLIVNAVHAIQARTDTTPSFGLIIISTSEPVPGTIEIRVRDNGMGMPEAVRARIFERYFTTKPVGMGTGQGLALAREVIEQRHAGKLSFESELGQGTTFIVRLPVGVRQETTDSSP